VRAWVTKPQGEGVKPGTIKYCLSVMSAIFTTALNDQLTAQHPCKGVKSTDGGSKLCKTWNRARRLSRSRSPAWIKT
jgi:hypothetical protein